MLQPPFAGLAAGFGQTDVNSAAAAGVAGMDFMKNLWGKLPSAVPGFVLPTLDIEELDKRIEDLRSVESWLTLNANMLKATIQGLEVQRNTLAALAALRDKGDFLGAMMNPAAASGWATQVPAEAQPKAANAPDSPGQSRSKVAYADAFSQSFGSGNPNWPLPRQGSDQPSQTSDDDPPPEVVAPQKLKKSVRRKTHKARAASRGSGASQAAGLVAPGAAQSANLWMNFLKDQFSQMANAAVAQPAAAAPAPVKKAVKAAARAPAKRGSGARSAAASKAPAKSAAKGATKPVPRR
jgi:hypothetical protein